MRVINCTWELVVNVVVVKESLKCMSCKTKFLNVALNTNVVVFMKIYKLNSLFNVVY